MAAVSERLPVTDRRVVGLGFLAVLALAVVPFVTTSYVTSLVMTGLIFVMLGVSWNLLAGYAGQISLGHAAFFGLGAYVCAWLTSPSSAGLPASLAMFPVVSLVVGGLAAALVALVIGPAMFRLRGHYFAIGTLALAAIIQLVLTDQRALSGGSTGYYLSTDLGEVTLYLLALLATVLVVVGTYYVVESRLGLAMRSIHDDEVAASGLGVGPLKYKMWAFVVSSFFAGLAGGAYALNMLYINPTSTLGVSWTIDTLVIVILGGMGTMAGPLVGAVLFMLLDNVLSVVVGSLATTVEGVLIILFVIFLPNGLWGYYQALRAGETEEGSRLDLRFWNS